jgi:hypothetical protein
MLQNDIVVPYLQAFATEEQQQRWLQPLAAGELMGCVAITEEGAGSDIAGCAPLPCVKATVTGSLAARRSSAAGSTPTSLSPWSAPIPGSGTAA